MRSETVGEEEIIVPYKLFWSCAGRTDEVEVEAEEVEKEVESAVNAGTALYAYVLLSYLRMDQTNGVK